MNSSPKADDICGVCETQRDEHGDKNHKFDIDGVLKPLDPPKPPSKQPPAKQGDPTPEKPDAHAAVLRLTEVLLQKGVLNSSDLFYIVGGHNANYRG